MKRIALLLAVGLLLFGLFGAMASANGIPALPRDPEVVWEDVVAVEGDAANAWVFRIKPGFKSECNITPRTESIEARAFVAQWARWEMDFSGWEWYVKKPGEYYGNCIKGELQSNGDIQLLFELADLEGGNPDTNTIIETYYSYTTGTNAPLTWYRAGSFPEAFVGDSTALHKGLTWKLWNKIKVVECNSPGMYANSGTITMVLANQAPWIDADGEFDRGWFNTDNGYLMVPGESL
ncbi:MAG: hypothetical protein GX977_11235 [Firmicutes bacterium]|jgi:hypothetical protein|nr:hypothetical protein [Bacillota bacterium]